MADGARPDRLPLRRRLLFAAVVVLVPLALGETVARLLLPRDPPQLLRNPLEGMVNREIVEVFRDHDELFWELRPGIDGSFGAWGDRTDDLGLRNARTPGEKDGRPRVLCLGDSCTYGLALTIADAWPTRLGEQGDLDVVNAGVPGYSSYQGRLLFDDRCAALDPDVLVVGFGHNDARVWGTLQDGVLHCLSDRERAVHIGFASVTRHSALLRWLTGLLTVPAAEGVPFAPDYDITYARPRVSPAEFRANLRHLATRAPRTVFVAWARRTQLDPEYDDQMPLASYLVYRDAVLEMEAEGHTVVDVERIYRASGLTPEKLFQDDTHPTPASARLISAAVREAVLSLAHDR